MRKEAIPSTSTTIILAFLRLLLSRPAVMFYAMAAPVWCVALVPPSRLRAWVELLSTLVLAGSIALWVANDFGRRRRTVPLDLAALVFFMWPVFVPVYLVLTRRWRATVPLGGFAALYLAAVLLGNVPFFLRALHR